MNTNKNLVWLASYPKSGNTWFRLFITALRNKGTIDINYLQTDGLYSSRNIFYNFTDIDSTLLLKEETKLLQPRVFSELSAHTAKEKLFLKIHDAYGINVKGDPIIPVAETHGVIYFVRNPLDIAASLAHHLNISIERAVQIMADETFSFGSSNNKNTTKQIDQLMMSWSMHVESWMDQTDVPVLIIRYEDMLSDSINTFKKAVAFSGLDVSEHEIINAMEAVSFKNLQSQEQKGIFKESIHPNRQFFRKGSSKNWKKELAPELINQIRKEHKKIMGYLGYL